MRRPLDRFLRITSRHGDKISGSLYGKHLGTDYAVVSNTPVKAPVGGKVVRQGWSGLVGNFIEINGVDNRLHRLLHLNRIDTKLNQNISQGQQIALSGSTGSTSTGPHVHWDARKAGTTFAGGFNNYFDTEQLAVAAESTPKPAPPSVVGTHTVARGESLSVIAARYGITWQQLYAYGNNKALVGANPNVLNIGQVINVPAGTTAPSVTTYRVVSGDNLSRIAIKYGTSTAQIVAWNKEKYPSLLTNPSLIQPNWELRVR